MKIKNIMDYGECKKHAERIMAMTDFSELVAACRVDERLALFCGVKTTSSEKEMEGAIEQWKVIKNKQK